MLDSTLELLDDPFSFVFSVVVLGNLPLDVFWNLKSAGCSFFGEVKLGSQLGCCLIVGTSRFYFQSKLKFVLAQLINKWDYSEWCLVVLLYPIVHYQELTVWRIDSQCPHLLKVLSVNAFMKGTVVKYYTRSCGVWPNMQIIVEHKS